MEALGKVLDVVAGCVPTDVVAGAVTGKRVHLKNYGHVCVVVVAAAGSTDRVDLDFQQHTAATGGTSSDLDVINHYYLKDAATLAGTETWTRVNQSVASEVNDIGTASQQQIAVFEVSATSLADGYEWFSVDAPDAGTNGTKFTAILYILTDLLVQRAPANLVNPQA
jgi:hypothetical protein